MGALTSLQQAFIDRLRPAAVAAGQRLGIDPRIIIAQAAQETGWGKSAPGNNFFGIKGPGQTQATTEFEGGRVVPQNASFRTFSSPEEAVSGYESVMSHPRYQGVRNAKGIVAQSQALGQSGYATDPTYGQSILSIASTLPPLPGSVDAVGAPHGPSLGVGSNDMRPRMRPDETGFGQEPQGSIMNSFGPDAWMPGQTKDYATRMANAPSSMPVPPDFERALTMAQAPRNVNVQPRGPVLPANVGAPVPQRTPLIDPARFRQNHPILAKMMGNK